MSHLFPTPTPLYRSEGSRVALGGQAQQPRPSLCAAALQWEGRNGRRTLPL